MLTRKDFALIAAELARGQPGPKEFRAMGQWRADCMGVAIALKAINPRFNSAKFLEACGVSTHDAS